MTLPSFTKKWWFIAAVGLLLGFFIIPLTPLGGIFSAAFAKVKSLIGKFTGNADAAAARAAGK